MVHDVGRLGLLLPRMDLPRLPPVLLRIGPGLGHHLVSPHLHAPPDLSYRPHDRQPQGDPCRI